MIIIKNHEKLMMLARVFILVLCSVTFLYGIFKDVYEIFPLAETQSKKVKGPDFAEIATYDGVMLKEGKFYDIYSAGGISLKSDENGNPRAAIIIPDGSGGMKECKT